MKLNDIDVENKDAYVKITDLDNFFSIYTDGRGNLSYNLNETLYLDIVPSALDEYVLKHDMHWPLISYKLYGTTRLAWLLLKINNVQTADIFKIIPASTTIKYLNTDYVNTIVSEMNDTRG